MKKRFVVIIVIAVFIVFNFFKTIFKKPEDELVFAGVGFGNVIVEVSETGQVKKGEQISLGFKTSGVIEKIYVDVGDAVDEGDVLAKLENSQLSIQVADAQANLDLYQAQLDKLLAGATDEEIQVKQTAVDNALVALNNAKQTLIDVTAQGEEDLSAAYEDALNVLDDAYLKIFNASNKVDSLQTAYFAGSDQESITVREKEADIEGILDLADSYVSTAKSTGLDADIDSALSQMKEGLDGVSNDLKTIRETCESNAYKNTVSSSYKTDLDTHRGYINTALTNIVNSQQTVSSTKLDNSVNVNSYSAKVDTAEGEWKAAKSDLAQLIAPPRQEDVNLYRAQVSQARAQLQLLNQQFSDTLLKSPADGQIVKVEKRVGELVQSALKDSVIAILPSDPFKIEVDIYEEDVAGMMEGNPAKISLVAFPDQKLTGKVLSIDPAEKIIDGIVYYEVSVSLDSAPQGLKPGMTADLTITIDSKENVLVVPEKAIDVKKGKATVQVWENRQAVEREIEIGLEGTNDFVEVLSGLGQGDQVIIP